MLPEKLESQLSNLEKRLFLVLMNPNYYGEHTIALSDMVFNKKSLSGIYVSVCKPAETIKRQMEERNIPTGNVFFIDAISLGRREGTQDMTYLGSPEDLTKISINIEKAINKRGPAGGKTIVVLLDSLSALLEYHSKEALMRFVHHITTTARNSENSAIVIALEENLEASGMAELGMFFDKVIKV